MDDGQEANKTYSRRWYNVEDYGGQRHERDPFMELGWIPIIKAEQPHKAKIDDVMKPTWPPREDDTTLDDKDFGHSLANKDVFIW